MDQGSPQRTATQRDVARALKLSQATVSRALRNLAVVPEAQRRAIQAVARRLGYQANPSATALSYARFARRAKPVRAALAWLNLWPDPKQLRSYPDFELYWRGATEQARKFGYHLEEFTLREFGTPERLQKILLARGIEGILIPPIARSDWNWGDFDWGHFCVVRMSRTVREPRVHLVTADQVANTVLAFQRIRARGYKRVGLFMLEHGRLPHHRHFAYGYLGAQLSLPPRERLRVFDGPHRNTQPAFERWLKRERPDAIITDWSILAGLRKAGYRVPQDIGLASTSVLGADVDAGIYQNPEEIGRVAVLVLAALIRDNDRGIPPIFRQILVEGKWFDGRTLPRRPEA